jgi:hypothetical protein
MRIREHRDVVSFRLAAARYCQLLESAPTDADRWAGEVLAAVATLYACGHALPEFSVDSDADIPGEFSVSDDEWKQVYRIVQDVFGTQAFYRCYFDPSEPLDAKLVPCVGDLSDDLADIYRDIKPGMRAWDANDDGYLLKIVFDWKLPLFGSHWGVHAVSAMRALHPIVYLRGIPNPS